VDDIRKGKVRAKDIDQRATVARLRLAAKLTNHDIPRFSPYDLTAERSEDLKRRLAARVYDP
jgi:hypothetical protein